MTERQLEQFQQALYILGKLYGEIEETKNFENNIDRFERKTMLMLANPQLNKNNILNRDSNNNEYSVIHLKQGSEKVKYKGITIFRKVNCKTWYTRYTAGGKQHYISGKTQKEVYNKLKECLKENDRNNSLSIRESSYSEWQKIWLERYKKDNKETTFKTYRSYENSLSEKFKNKKIKNILEIDIIEELNNVNGERQKQKVYQYLKDIFNKARQNNIININPLELIDKPKYNKNTRNSLSSVEELQFEKECKKLIFENDNKSKYAMFYLLMLYQGLRPGECLALKPSKFDLKNKRLSITNSINANSKEDNTKNENSVRDIPLFEKTINLLNETKFLEDKEQEEYLFKFSNNSICDNFNAINKSIGIKKYVPYELRHTFITRLKEQNIPEHIIQEWVGHEIGSKVTSTVYTHFDKTNEIKYINILNEQK